VCSPIEPTEETVRTHTKPAAGARLVGTCGVAAVVLILVAPTLDGPIGTAGWVAGVMLLLPFLGGLAMVLSTDADSSRWLAPVMSAGAAIALTLHLVILGMAHVADSVPKDSAVHEPLHAVESALFGIALLPLGIAVAAAAVAIVRHRRLPRWFGYATGVVAVALFANGGQLGTEEMPALMLFLLWILVVSVILLVRRRVAIEAPEPEAAVPAVG
jgi:hypothetical protein